MVNENPRIFFLRKTRIRELSFCGKRESENSRFVDNENPRILVLWKMRIRQFVENENPSIFVLSKTRILFLWKMRMREISICGKRESLKSRFVENEIP